MTRKIFIVLLCFKNIAAYIISLESLQIQGYGNITLVLQTRKPRPALAHLIPAFPLFIVSFVSYISVRD